MDQHLILNSEFDDTPMSVSVVVRSPLLREGLNKFLTDAGASVHCEVLIEEEALIQAARDRDADVIVVDGSLCEQPSRLVTSLSQAVPQARIVIMTANGNESRIGKDCLAVAGGVLSSDISREAMAQALRLIRLGARVVLPDLTTDISRARSPGRDDDAAVSSALAVSQLDQSPSPRETEILHYLVSGCSNKAIARELGITEATVKVHLKGLLRKIGVANRTQAAVWALNNGMRSHHSADSTRLSRPAI